MTSKARKRRYPFVLEMQAFGKWIEVARFAFEDEARLRLKRVENESPEKPVLRVREDDGSSKS